ncbi:MAG: C4-dicarboxylate ABC transporter substrate-binding protein, partial [Betaproteobacteria bacterium]|nr:C4-dicarboxylate ABC transporter substrate-binding protein [Betaproteobacteria bacterium]
MKFRSYALAAAAALVVLPVSAKAQTRLIIGSWAAPTHEVNTTLFPHWAQEVEKATGGRVKFEIKYNLAPPPGYFDAVRDGVADA